MNRQELEHIVRAAAGITGQREFIIIGSQSILGKFPDAPRSLRHSMELDLYPKDHPELAELISGCLGSFQLFIPPLIITPMGSPYDRNSSDRLAGSASPVFLRQYQWSDRPLP